MSPARVVSPGCTSSGRWRGRLPRGEDARESTPHRDLESWCTGRVTRASGLPGRARESALHRKGRAEVRRRLVQIDPVPQ